MKAIGAVLDLQGSRPAADRHAGVIDGRDEVIELGAIERSRLDDLAPAAEIAAFDPVGDSAADALVVGGEQVGSAALVARAGLSRTLYGASLSAGRFS